MTARDRQDSRRAGMKERAAITRPELAKLIDWHERCASVKRMNADRETIPTSRAALLGNAETHQVAAAVLQRVLEGMPVDGDGR